MIIIVSGFTLDPPMCMPLQYNVQNRMQFYNHYSLLLSFYVDFNPPDDRKKKILITVGTVVLVSSLILLILGILRWKGCLGGRTSREQGNLVLISLTSQNTNEAVL